MRGAPGRRPKPKKRPNIDKLVERTFLGDEDPGFQAFVGRMPDSHWAKYDLSAVRLGWEAHKTLYT